MDEVLERWRAAGSFLTLGGRRLFLRREGRGPPVLAMHGYPLSSFDFSRVWAALTAAHDVIALDLPGFGFSERPLQSQSFAELAALHEELLAHLGVRRPHVVSFDLGTAVAQELLARGDERSLASVAFLNGSLFPEVYRPRLVQRVLASPMGGWVGPRLPPSMVKRALAKLFGPDTPPSDADLQRFLEVVDFGEGRRTTHLHNRLIFSRREQRDRWLAAMQNTRVPLRLINGAADPNSGAHMERRYRELVPNPDVVRLEGIGHWPLFEAPERCAEALLAFWAAH